MVGMMDTTKNSGQHQHDRRPARRIEGDRHEQAEHHRQHAEDGREQGHLLGRLGQRPGRGGRHDQEGDSQQGANDLDGDGHHQRQHQDKMPPRPPAASPPPPQVLVHAERQQWTPHEGQRRQRRRPAEHDPAQVAGGNGEDVAEQERHQVDLGRAPSRPRPLRLAKRCMRKHAQQRVERPHLLATQRDQCCADPERDDDHPECQIDARARCRARHAEQAGVRETVEPKYDIRRQTTRQPSGAAMMPSATPATSARNRNGSSIRNFLGWNFWELAGWQAKAGWSHPGLVRVVVVMLASRSEGTRRTAAEQANILGMLRHGDGHAMTADVPVETDHPVACRASPRAGRG